MSEFNNQSVRDLAWAISSPPLVTNLSATCVWPGSEWFQQLYQESLPWLLTIDEHPAELEELLDAVNSVLDKSGKNRALTLLEVKSS